MNSLFIVKYSRDKCDVICLIAKAEDPKDTRQFTIWGIKKLGICHEIVVDSFIQNMIATKGTVVLQATEVFSFQNGFCTMHDF